jgi:hypothetical protein
MCRGGKLDHASKRGLLGIWRPQVHYKRLQVPVHCALCSLFFTHFLIALLTAIFIACRQGKADPLKGRHTAHLCHIMTSPSKLGRGRPPVLSVLVENEIAKAITLWHHRCVLFLFIANANTAVAAVLLSLQQLLLCPS